MGLNPSLSLPRLGAPPKDLCPEFSNNGSSLLNYFRVYGYSFTLNPQMKMEMKDGGDLILGSKKIPQMFHLSLKKMPRSEVSFSGAERQADTATRILSQRLANHLPCFPTQSFDYHR